MPPADMTASALHEVVLGWYDEHARDLPWRQSDISAWSVLVSEVMLQQTPVARVLPAYTAWLERFPTPAALAAAPVGEAVRHWGRLGYPRRALRLHAAAVVCVRSHHGQVPRDLHDLLALPGVGAYSARAVASFAYRQRHPVVDTNVRRVLARAVDGQADPGPPSAIRDLQAGQALLPDDPETAARWAIAVMELGALVCTARAPRCSGCPLHDSCAWRRAGAPAYTGPVRQGQAFAGTDRQVRGRLLDVVRSSDGPVTHEQLSAVWDEPEQRDRALASLLADGLVEALPDGHLRLPR